MAKRSIIDGRVLERKEISQRKINNSRKLKRWSQSETSVKVDNAKKILERSIADVGKLKRRSSSIASTMVEWKKNEEKILEQSIYDGRMIEDWREDLGA
jgi:hypothetical protein